MSEHERPKYWDYSPHEPCSDSELDDLDSIVGLGNENSANECGRAAAECRAWRREVPELRAALSDCDDALAACQAQAGGRIAALERELAAAKAALAESVPKSEIAAVIADMELAEKTADSWETREALMSYAALFRGFVCTAHYLPEEEEA